MPPLIYTVPYGPPRIRSFVVRTCFAIAMLAAVVITVNRFLYILERNPPHGNANSSPRYHIHAQPSSAR